GRGAGPALPGARPPAPLRARPPPRRRRLVLRDSLDRLDADRLRPVGRLAGRALAPAARRLPGPLHRALRRARRATLARRRRALAGRAARALGRAGGGARLAAHRLPLEPRGLRLARGP